MASGTATRILEVRLLGGFTVLVDGRPLPPSAWRRKRAAALIKLLALEPSHRLHREQVIEVLWPELDPEAAANNLRFTLHEARERLAEAGASRETVLLRDGEVLVLGAPEVLAVDVDAFERAAAAAWKSDDPALATAALARYPGDLLPEDPYEDWAESRRAALRAGYLALLRRLAEIHLAQGEGVPAVAALERLVTAEPSDEAAHVELMRVLARIGKRQRALAQYDRLVAALDREVGAAPEPATTRLRDDIMAGRYPTPRPAPPAAAVARDGKPPAGATAGSPLPRAKAALPVPITAIVGREREVAEVGQLLTTARLVTLTGPGGVGKTRLAIEVASGAASAFPDGAWFVGLASIGDPSLVASTIAHVLGIREAGNQPLTARLAAFLHDKHLLLVLDNFEQVVEAATLVSDLLASCPDVRMLVTSRVRLRLSAEREYPVPPLGLGETGRRGAENLIQSEAVRLFVERAQAVKPDFVLTTENAPEVAAVCVRLDGLPLAIELAAVRVKVLRLPALLDRMERRLPLLTGGARDLPARQQTMRDAIAWSYDLLDATERALFRRLSIFAGAFTLDAVSWVMGCLGDGVIGERTSFPITPSPHDPITLDLVASLVDKSLLRQEEASGGEPAYVLLETVREFGREQLVVHGETEELRRRHASWYLALAERAAPHLLGPEQRRWVEQLDRDLPNLRAALIWMFEQDEAEQALRLAGALSSFWFLRGHLREGTAWLDQALTRAAHAPPDTQSWALFSTGMLTWGGGDFAQTEAIANRALTHAREHDLVFGEAAALYLRFLISLAQGHDEQGVAIGERALARMREAGNHAWLAYVLGDVGVALIMAGERDRERGAALVEEGLTLHRELGNKQGVGNKLSDLGILKHDAGDEAGATRDYAESLRLLWEGGDTWYLATPVAGLAAVAMSAGQAVQASRLLGAAAALRARSGGALWPNEQARLERTVAAARAALGDAAYEREVAAGQALPLAEVIAEAAGIAEAAPGTA